METAKFSRRNMLGLIGVTAGTGLIGCQTNKKIETAKTGIFVTRDAIKFAEQASVGLATCHGADEHSLQGHPESRLRTEVIEAAVVSAQSKKYLKEFRAVPERPASVQEILRVHSIEYVEQIQKASRSGVYLTQDRWAPYGGPHAFQAACASAGAAISLVRSIDEKRFKSGFALTRPPGHHASRDSSGGYCLFNNIAIAVRDLQERKRAEGVIARVAIVDVDVHHGNGIQDTFYQDPNVLYISSHQNDWPFTGAIDKGGKGAGIGTNINIPLPFDTGDAGLRSVYQHVVEPALNRFKPDCIVVATGFDTHWRDYQGSFILSNSGILEITKLLCDVAKKLCDGKIGFVLEGGYQLETLASASVNLLGLLAGAESSSFQDSFGKSDRKEADVSSVTEKVRKIHKLA